MATMAMNKPIDFYRDLVFYFSAWAITATSVKEKISHSFTYHVTLTKGVCVVYYITASAEPSSSLLAQFKVDRGPDHKVAFWFNNQDGQTSQDEFRPGEYLNRLMGVSCCFSAFIPGCILAGDSAYRQLPLPVKFTYDKTVFDTQACGNEFLLLLEENGQIRQAKYLIGEGEVQIKNMDAFAIKGSMGANLT